MLPFSGADGGFDKLNRNNLLLLKRRLAARQRKVAAIDGGADSESGGGFKMHKRELTNKLRELRCGAPKFFFTF